jgi:hypothetical protein
VNINNNSESKKNTVTMSELITAECALSFMFVFLVRKSQVSYSIIPSLLEQGVGVGGAVCKTFG